MRAYLFLLLCGASFGFTVASDRASPQGVVLERVSFSGTAATGRCSPATITITGVENETAYRTKYLIGSSGTILIRSGKSTLAIGGNRTTTIFLQDENALHCLPTPKGPKLVLASYCFGRDCAPVDYRVIDPSTAKVISRQNSADECDEVCTEKALGLKLPEGLRAP
jgi:hypothetical protein